MPIGGSVKMDYKEFIDLVGERLGVPRVFRDSIFGIESAGGKPDIHDSIKGAMGPGQLMPDTARRLGVNPRDPAQNIYGSLKLQKQLLDKYRKITGDEDKAWLLAAAAYNAGETAVDKHGGIPPYQETRNYVKQLAERMRAGKRIPQKAQSVSSLPPISSSILTPSPGLSPIPTSSTAQPSQQIGLTPPSQTEGFIKSMARGASLGNLGVFSEDTRRAFSEGIVSATGSLLADFGWAATNPVLSPAGYLTKKLLEPLGGPKKHPFETLGTSLEQGAAESQAKHKASTTSGRFRQSIARGTGASLVEIPKLVGSSMVLGPATLPAYGALAGARQEGTVGGVVKGAAMGLVYHYGGQLTGKYLGQLGNTLFWVGAPAVEQHLVNGVPLEEAIGSSIPMGLFAGAGGSDRALIKLPNGKTRPATPLDIPRILKGSIKLAEPSQVVGYGALEVARRKFSQLATEQGGFAKLREGEGGKGPLTRLPKKILSDLVTIGAFHYEAGTRGFDDWMGRMLPELGETPDSIKPQVAKQLGEVYARSKDVYEQGKAPIFFSGLKQTVKELYATDLIGKNVPNADRLINLLKSRGQAEELEASGLIEELARVKQGGGKFTIEDVINYLDTKGMTMDVLRGGESKASNKWAASFENEEGGPGTLPGLATRGPYVTPGGRDYFEGVVHTNKALDFSTDEVHFGFRPDQISWYRGQLMGEARPEVKYVRNPAIPEGERGSYEIVDQRTGETLDQAPGLAGARHLVNAWKNRQGEDIAPAIGVLEEVQSKRAQKARVADVTKDPNNAHSQLVALEREMAEVTKRASEIEQELGLSRWEATDEYSRYEPGDAEWIYYTNQDGETVSEIRGYSDRKAAENRPSEKVRELDKLRALISSMEHEIHNLEYFTDSPEAPIPWSPHLGTWYEPALKGFLREAAERLEPDQEGNVRITWTPASEQLTRYPNARKEVNDIGWIQEFDETSGKAAWNVTLHFKAANGQDKAQTYNELSESQLKNLVGKEAANRIINSEDIVGSLPVGGQGMGGEWTVRLYGDTQESIRNLYSNKPELLEYAWKETGNKAIVPAWLEKYAKAWGGRVELGTKAAFEIPDFPTNVKIPETIVPHLVIPEQMRLTLLKQGQLFFGRKLGELPKGKGYGLRNRITEEQSAQLARELIAKNYKTATNVYGHRIPSPERKEGGFLGLGKRPELDPKVKTDLEDRGKDTSSIGVFFRSPSRWMMSFEDKRVDQISERMFDAEVREHDYTTEWGRRFSAIIDHLQAATFAKVTGTSSSYKVEGQTKPRKIFGRAEDKEALKATFSDFIELIEKPFEVDGPPLTTPQGQVITPKIQNPDRIPSNPLIERALKEHDALANEFKDYLIQSYADRGIAIADPANWGISEKGYFRHLFPGEDNIFMNGDYQGTGETYLDAIKKANDLIEANPNAQVEIRRRPVQFVDPSLRVSTKSFERLVSKLTGSVNDQGQQIITARDIREDLVGTVGKKENIGKFFAASLKREGYEGYLREYEQVMRAHYFQLARSQELSKLRKDITPLLEELRREGMRGVVEGIERHLDDLWGKPLAYEKAVGGFIRRFPALRERIANPDLGLELMARRIAGFHNLLKLRYNPKAMFVNFLQPLRTLWPYLTNKDMMETIKRYRDPKWRQDMTELGVMMGAVKLETGGSKVEGFGAREFLKDPFTYVSGHNRALGYTAGVIHAERDGLTGYEAHKMGMKWAAKVEFDNSKWDAPRFLRHSLGQIFGQYKGFLIKDIENAVDVFSKQAGDSATRPNLSKASRVGKWFGGTVAFGGLRAAASPIPWLGTALGYSMYLGGAALIKAATGTSDKDAKFYSSILFLGLPAAANLDLSASLTPIDDPPGLTAWEKVGRWAGGPTPSSTYDITRATQQLVAPGKREKRTVGERIFNLGTKVSPYVRMVQRGYQLEQSVVHGKPQYLTIDQHRVKLTKPQMALGAFGAPPANQTLYYEEKEATGKSPLSKSSFSSPFGSPTRGILEAPSPFHPLPKR